MSPSDNPVYWLDLHQRERYNWTQHDAAQRTWSRPLGVVESLFDADGTYFEGRADLHHNIFLKARIDVDPQVFRERLTLAWTVMRYAHVLLSCRTRFDEAQARANGRLRWTDKQFVYSHPSSVAAAVDETRKHVRFVGDHYDVVDGNEFYHHLANTTRALDPNECLSRLYVLPVPAGEGVVDLRLIVVLAHQIADGLTLYRWTNHMVELMNKSADGLTDLLTQLVRSTEKLYRSLPPAQEALYPTRSHVPARDRWHWLLTRILRHVRKPPPASFQNPCLRSQPLLQARSLEHKFSRVLDYSRTPPLNSLQVKVCVAGRASSNIRALCRQAKISVGSGLFGLAAMAMMAMEEQGHPDMSPSCRLPFVGSFPVNSRPFLTGPSTVGRENSCMLAFSDGVTLPFLSSDLDLGGRFRLLGKQAHRQLRQYQKRKRSVEEELHLGSRSPSQLLPTLFCSTVERMEARAEPQYKADIDVQGLYPAKSSPTLATCGISSVGDISGLAPIGRFDLSKRTGRDLAVDLAETSGGVRPRDGEFLIGALGRDNVFEFFVSCDLNALDPQKIEVWMKLMQSLLDTDGLIHSDRENSKSKL